MKNDYKVLGEFTIIYLKRKNSGLLETIIDTVDLERAKEFPLSWYANSSKHGQLYVKGHIKKEEKQSTTSLHQWLMSTNNECLIDHFNHNGLDNRRSTNLRKATGFENQQNRKGPNKNSKSGIRGVYWNEVGGKWNAQISINHKDTNLGSFTSKEEAEKAVLEARSKFMPFSNDVINS